jgi:hypothetical protein
VYGANVHKSRSQDKESEKKRKRKLILEEVESGKGRK